MLERNHVSGHDFSRAAKQVTDLGFSPCDLLLLAEIKGTVRIFVRRRSQSAFDRILANIRPVRQKTRAIANALVGEASLPDFMRDSQLAFNAEREVPF
jgi:hypothetical protein